MVLAQPEQPTLDSVVREIAELRPLPGVASAALHITDSDRFSAHELAKVISADQALTAKVLRLSNSAYYGFPRRIGTVRDAIVLIGFRAVRSAVLASSVMEVHRDPQSIDYRTFWRFSVTVGVLAELVAQSERGPFEEAFTAGVLHNIGRLALDQHMPDQFIECRRRAERDQMSMHEAERKVLGYTDAELGAALARHWSFPEELVDAVAHHPLNVYAVPDEEGSLTAYVVRARRFALAYGLSDSVEVPHVRMAPTEWSAPPLGDVLARAGGMDGVLHRVGIFLDSTIAP
jgi:HD-like signal output (HDOD) protein